MKYKCWFLINPNQEEREFKEIEDKASSIFLQFIEEKEYSKKVGLYWFDVYVKQEINFGLHNDSVFDGCARLTCHIDYEIFMGSNEKQKLKLLLNASFRQIEYLQKKVAVPKDFNTTELLHDYDEFLKLNNYKLSDLDIDKYVIKVFDSMKFNFHITTTIEVKEDKIHYDLIELEYFINNKLVGKTFGTSIEQFDFGYELYDFTGQFAEFNQQTIGLKKYRTKYKAILIVKHFDYAVIENLEAEEQINILTSSILEAIKDVETMKRKPKDFRINDFYIEMEKILEEYKKSQGTTANNN